MLAVVIKVLALLLTSLVIIKSYLSYRQHQETMIMFMFWSITWLIILVVAFFPDIVTTILGERKVGVGGVLGVALVFVYYVLYRVYVKADRIEKKMHEIVRRLSISDYEKTKKK